MQLLYTHHLNPHHQTTAPPPVPYLSRLLLSLLLHIPGLWYNLCFGLAPRSLPLRPSLLCSAVLLCCPSCSALPPRSFIHSCYHKFFRFIQMPGVRHCRPHALRPL